MRRGVAGKGHGGNKDDEEEEEGKRFIRFNSVAAFLVNGKCTHF